MIYLNIKLSTVRSSEYVGSDPASRGTWLSVSAFCADQENGGVIKNCKGWKSRVWEQLCGVTREEINAAPLLLKWSGQDLVVFDYPEEQEQIMRAKRKGASAGGKKRAENLAKQSLLDEMLIDPTKGVAGEPGRPLKVTGYADINDTRNDLVDVASAVTGDRSDMGRGYWRKALEKIGPEQFRAQLVTLWGEMNAGEKPKNPASALTAKIKKLVERHEARGAA